MNEYDFGYNQPVNNKNACLKNKAGYLNNYLVQPFLTTFIFFLLIDQKQWREKKEKRE